MRTIATRTLAVLLAVSCGTLRESRRLDIEEILSYVDVEEARSELRQGETIRGDL